MLSVSKKIWISILSLFMTTFIFAANVSKMDISGTRLGMSIDNTTICKKASIEKSMAYSPSYIEFTGGYKKGCNLNKYDTFNDNMFADHNKKIYGISKSKYFSVTPTFSEIKKQIISKYGSDYKEYNNKHREQYHMCYGDCYISKLSGRFHEYKGNNKTLVIIFYYNKSSPALSIDLTDWKRILENDTWKDKEGKKIDALIKKQESKINF